MTCPDNEQVTIVYKDSYPTETYTTGPEGQDYDLWEVKDDCLWLHKYETCKIIPLVGIHAIKVDDV